MNTYLEFHDNTSHKYWEITVKGIDVIVHFGKVHTKGQTKTKSFNSHDKAVLAAQKLIQSKLNKGYEYVKTDNSQSPSKLQWDEKQDKNKTGTAPEKKEAQLYHGRVEKYYAGKRLIKTLHYHEGKLYKTVLWEKGAYVDSKEHGDILQEGPDFFKEAKISYYPEKNSLYVKYWQEPEIELDTKQYKTVYHLFLDHSLKLKSFGKVVKQYPRLKSLSIMNTSIQFIPEEIGILKELEQLKIWSRTLLGLPKEIGNLKKLEKLELTHNSILAIPDSFSGLCSLKEFILHSFIDMLPGGLGRLTHLRYLEVRSPFLKELPEDLGELANIEILKLANNKLDSIPASISQLSRLKILDLSGNNFKHLPDLKHSTLKTLNLTKNHLEKIPGLTGLPSLKSLNVSHNNISSVSGDVIKSLHTISFLIDNNPLTEIPGGLDKKAHQSILRAYEQYEKHLRMEEKKKKERIAAGKAREEFEKQSLPETTFPSSLDIPFVCKIRFTDSGKLTGNVFFYRDRTHVLHTQWKEGRLHGKIIYKAGDNILREQTWENGHAAGESSCRDSEGNMLQKIVYENGRIKKCEFYHKGTLYKSCFFNNGALEKIKRINDSAPNSKKLREPVISYDEYRKSLRIEYWQNTPLNLNPEKYPEVKKLTIAKSSIKDLSVIIKEFKTLTSLAFYSTSLDVLPDTLGELTLLEELVFSDTLLAGLPESFCDLKALKAFKVISSPLIALPENLGKLNSLETMHLKSTHIEELPESLGTCRNLTTLYAGGGEKASRMGFLKYIPKTITGCTKLTNLTLSYQPLFSLPETLGSLTSLKRLVLEGNCLTRLPESISKLKQLEVFCAPYNYLTCLPSLKELTSLNTLVLIDDTLDSFTDISTNGVLLRIQTGDRLVKADPAFLLRMSKLYTYCVKPNPKGEIDEYYFILKPAGRKI